MDKKKAAVELLRSFETKDRSVAERIISPQKYVQHNLGAADGREGFLQLLKMPVPFKVNVVRVFQDGDCVFTHTDYDFFGPKIGFDILRFEGDQAVEHWDNLTVKPEESNPSDRTMIDGPTMATDLEHTQENKKLVAGFVKYVLINGDFSLMARFLDGNYIQHNPVMGDGVPALIAGMAAFVKQGMGIVYEKNHMILGEGNFVLAVCSGRLGPQPVAFYDLFRVEKGKIAEHWDAIQAIPPKSEWKNGNGKF
jgi:predicted SnoaL-like aldol condensation-catalyzing enzyme